MMIKSLLIPLALVFATSAADAQITVRVGIAPPAAYIATTQPEYFEGRPVYWYNNNWYYRDHGRWSYYRSEPGYLRDRRAHWREHDRIEHERVERGRVEHGREVRHEGPVRYRYRR
jgi:hypothetical protein